MPQISSPTGVIGDPRLDPRVIAGWRAEDYLPAGAVEWRPKQDNELKQYTIWNQDGSSACVAFSKAKQLSIEVFRLTGVWIDFSPASIYQLRANKPGLGMHIPDANDIVNKRGATLEALMKSQNLTEEQINSVKRTKVADLFAGAIAEAVGRYLYVPVDIDRIAQTIESKKAVSLLMFGTSAEYSRKVPIVFNPSLTYAAAPIHHEVIAVDYFLDANGVKRLLINDSSHFGGYTEREITEDFLLKRCTLADAIDVFTFEPGTDQKPGYDGSVASLQDCLKFEGLFPANQPSTGVYGAITTKAVKEFQVKYGLEPVGTVGPKTKAKLQELYPQY